MRNVLYLTCLAILLCGFVYPQGNPELSKLAWIAGCWKGDGDVQIEEQWTKLAGQSMLGVGRTIRNGKTVSSEFLQIRERSDGIFYIALPSKPPSPHKSEEYEGNFVPFKLVKVNDSQAIFENPEHDFPQRIIYQKQTDGSLLAAIEGEEKGRPRRIEFPMKRVKCD